MNEQPDTIYQALSRVQASMGEIVKDARGQHSSYATLPNVLGAINTALRRHGCVQHQRYAWVDGVNVLETLIIHIASNEKILSSFKTPSAQGQNPIHAEGAVQTYFRRYTLLMALGIAPGIQDSDGELDEELPVSAPQPITISERKSTPVLNPPADEDEKGRCVSAVGNFKAKHPEGFEELLVDFGKYFSLDGPMTPQDIQEARHIRFIDEFMESHISAGRH